ncbi:hypothetical protein FRC02_003883 [Tulasnella sp. 418]|nr:hypothetical protein FRC02_003883 [Tulasnella sp. 418]
MPPKYPVIPPHEDPRGNIGQTSDKPSFEYDQHLHRNIVLKRVVHCPDLVNIMMDSLRDDFLKLEQSLETSLTRTFAAAIDVSEEIDGLSNEVSMGNAFTYSIAYPATQVTQYWLNANQSTEEVNHFQIRLRNDGDTLKSIADGVWYLQPDRSPVPV